MRITLKQLETGKTKTLKIGWSWTLFFFSSLYGIPLFLRGLKFWGLLMFGVGILTAIRNLSLPYDVGLLDYALIAFLFLSAIFFGLKGNELTLKQRIKDGWVFANEQSKDGDFVRQTIDVPNEKQQALHYYSTIGMEKYQSKDYAGAISDYTSGLAVDPLNDILFSLRGVAKIDSHDFSGAIADFTQAIQLNQQSAEAYCNRGRAFLHKKEYDKAIADESRAIQLDAKYDEAYYYRGEAQFGLQKYEDAITDYTRALEISPGSTRVYLQRGMAKLFSGDKQGALGDLERARQSKNPFYADWASKTIETFYK